MICHPGTYGHVDDSTLKMKALLLEIKTLHDPLCKTKTSTFSQISVIDFMTLYINQTNVFFFTL